MSLSPLRSQGPNGVRAAHRRVRLRAAKKREQRQRLDAQIPAEHTRRRRYYEGLPWARQSCAWCNCPVYSLHHVKYRVPWPKEIGFVVPLCPYHHALFHAELWPRLRKGGFKLAEATLFVVVHGDGARLLLAAKSAQMSLDEEAAR
jgi:hypothetical protein